MRRIKNLIRVSRRGFSSSGQIQARKWEIEEADVNKEDNIERLSMSIPRGMDQTYQTLTRIYHSLRDNSMIPKFESKSDRSCGLYWFTRYLALTALEDRNSEFVYFAFDLAGYFVTLTLNLHEKILLDFDIVSKLEKYILENFEDPVFSKFFSVNILLAAVNLNCHALVDQMIWKLAKKELFSFSASQEAKPSLKSFLIMKRCGISKHSNYFASCLTQDLGAEHRHAWWLGVVFEIALSSKMPVSFRFRKLVEEILRQVEESPEVLEDILNQFVMSATMTVKTELLNEDFLCFLKDYMIQKFLERPKNRKILSSLFIFISSPTVRSKLKDNFADVHQLIFKTLEKLYDPHEEFPLLKTFLKPDLIDSDFSVYMSLLKRMSIYISGEQKSLSLSFILLPFEDQKEVLYQFFSLSGIPSRISFIIIEAARVRANSVGLDFDCPRTSPEKQTLEFIKMTKPVPIFCPEIRNLLLTQTYTAFDLNYIKQFPEHYDLCVRRLTRTLSSLRSAMAMRFTNTIDPQVLADLWVSAVEQIPDLSPQVFMTSLGMGESTERKLLTPAFLAEVIARIEIRLKALTPEKRKLVLDSVRNMRSDYIPIISKAAYFSHSKFPGLLLRVFAKEASGLDVLEACAENFFPIVLSPQVIEAYLDQDNFFRDRVFLMYSSLLDPSKYSFEKLFGKSAKESFETYLFEPQADRKKLLSLLEKQKVVRDLDVAQTIIIRAIVLGEELLPFEMESPSMARKILLWLEKLASLGINTKELSALFEARMEDIDRKHPENRV